MSVIASDKSLEKTFLDITSHAKVVIACRVSPAQKADIVNLVKHRYPEKTCLSIGDGANDVSMILAAHVGVGILGKEGSQAARSADYAFGQFKFLKRLLFVHGREDYRRNSFLAAYMFYKNILYVMTQYYFGFASGFSGQTLYDALIYQVYNITCTSLPIGWYATFDWQYKRKQEEGDSNKEKYLLKNPELYGIGLRSECFSVTIFGQWLLYGLWHAVIIYGTCMLVLSNPETMQSDGKDIGFWVSG